MLKHKAIMVNMVLRRFMMLVVLLLCEDTIFFQNGKTFIYLLDDSNLTLIC